jgi:hypothetical protein
MAFAVLIGTPPANVTAHILAGYEALKQRHWPQSLPLKKNMAGGSLLY